MQTTTKLFNRNFIIMFVATFLMFTGFYLLMPIIAMYVTDTFQASNTTIGIVVSIYIISALLTRPFSGYFVDRFDRKKFYLITLFIFALLFLGYVVSASILALIITRVLLGATFSMVTTASNTLAIDLMPSERRNEGIGYIGASTVLAMATGPMLGLYLIEYFSYQTLFYVAFFTASIGFLVGCTVKTTPRKHITKEPLSFDRFIVKEGVPIAATMTLIYFLYGTLMTYIPLYIRECSLSVSSGNYFLFMSLGVIISRFSIGKLLNKGLHNKIIIAGLIMIISAMTIFIFFINDFTFITSSLMIGIGYGFLSPSIQSMIIDLVPHNRRGTANSTYFVALDLGSGIGMMLGGVIAEAVSYRTTYIAGFSLCILALLYYTLFAKKHYYKQLLISKKKSSSYCKL